MATITATINIMDATADKTFSLKCNISLNAVNVAIPIVKTPIKHANEPTENLKNKNPVLDRLHMI